MNFDELFPDKISIQKYIDEKKPLNIIDNETHQTILMFVCVNNYPDIAMEILKFSAEEIGLGLVDNYGETAIKYACQNNFEEVALKMLDFGWEEVNLSYHNSELNSETALLICCMFDMKEVALKMLDFGAKAVSINAQNANKETALISSCYFEWDDISLKILDFGAEDVDLMLYNILGDTALMTAIEKKSVEVVNKMLTDYPPDKLNLFTLNANEESALIIADKMDLTDISDQIRNMEYQLQREYDANNMDIGLESDGEPDEVTYHIPKDIISNKKKKFYEGVIPELPNIIPDPIDINQIGWDPIMSDEMTVKEYLEQNENDNIAVSYKNKIFLLTRSLLKNQHDSSTLFECLEPDNIDSSNIVYNLPLCNLRTIGVVQIDVNYIYESNITNIIDNVDKTSLYTIIPFPNKKIKSVITLENMNYVLEDNGMDSYCKVSEGGNVGFIAPNKQQTGGNKKYYKKTKKNRKKIGKKTINKTIKKRRNIYFKNKTLKLKYKK